MTLTIEKIETQLAPKFSFGEHNCWLWQGATDRKGYGRFNIRNNNRLAHRVMYEVTTGPIPAGLQLDHLCEVKNCVNPEHLEPVTGQENMARIIHPATLKTTCVKGHPYTETNTYVAVTAKGKERRCNECRRIQRRAHYAKLKA
jgi:hypothetical protein